MPRDHLTMMGGIAIYERDELMRALLQEWLTAAGYRVRDTSGATTSFLPELAVVSVDSPKTGGEVVLRGLKRQYPSMPIIALSGRARAGLSSNGAAAQALGVERLLAKPLKRHELLVAVDAVIGPRAS